MVIYYFSATGNSLHIAKTVAGKLGECRLAAIRPGQKSEVPDAEAIGLVFPLHYFGLPPAVKSFVGGLETKAVKYIFAIVTCGNRHISSALYQLDELLQDKGHGLDAGFLVPMVSSYIPLSALPPVPKRQSVLAKADAECERITGLIKARAHIISPEYLRHLSRPINGYWQKKLLPKSHKRFSLSSGCSACGLCVKVCLADNIHMADGRPRWGGACQECLACLHFCPGECIQFGMSKDRERYHHPAISAEDIIREK